MKRMKLLKGTPTVFLLAAFAALAYWQAAPAATTNALGSLGFAATPGTPITNSARPRASITGAQTNRAAGNMATRQRPFATDSQPDEVGPNYRLWSTAKVEEASGFGAVTNKLGKKNSRAASRRIMEIGTGMHYRQGDRWVPSVPVFEISVSENAFLAERIQHKVRLAADLNSEGSVVVVTPNGITLRSTPVAIGLFDAATGRSEMIAALTNSAGILVNTNQVLYKDAFNENGVRASVLFTVERGSFAQDVILTARLNPASYGFPPDTTRIQIWTEYYGAPEPDRIHHPLRVEKSQAKRRQMASPDLMDEVIGFGDFVFNGGKAYSTSERNSVVGIAVAKEFRTLEHRKFLIESVEYPAIEKQLASLAESKSRLASTRSRKLTDGSLSLPAPIQNGLSTLKLTANKQLALNVQPSPEGVVIDPVAEIGGTANVPIVFQGDTTYMVTDAAYCNGPVTIEGGAVFKFWNSTGPGAWTTFIKLNNSLTLQTDTYRPAIFTAFDDDSVGDQLAGSWGDTTGILYADPALRIATENLDLHDCRFIYCNRAIEYAYAGGDPQLTIANSQFVDCVTGISVSMGSSKTVRVNNCLFARTQYITQDQGGSSDEYWTFTHCTIDSATACVSTEPTELTFYNCVFANVSGYGISMNYQPDNGGGPNGFFNSEVFGNNPVSDSTYPFAPIGYLDNQSPPTAWYWVANAQGGYYLRTDSPFVNAASSTGPVALDLSQRTTTVPELFNQDVNSSMTLGPSSVRDTDTPDLGYHYPAVDYVLAGATVNNCTLNIDQGTVLAFATPYYEANGRTEATHYWNRYALPSYEWGIRLNAGGRLNVNGTPTNRVTFARLEAVQENALFPAVWFGEYVPLVTFKGVFTPNGTVVTPLAEARVRFAEFPTLAGLVSHFSDLYYDNTYDLVKSLELEGCHLYSGFLLYDVGSLAGRTVSMRNNIFERSRVDFEDLGFGHGEESETTAVCNNLFYGCYVALAAVAGSFTDNIFDQVFFPSYLGQTYNQVAANHHNAYVGMSTRLAPAAPITTDPNLASLAYQPGPLGRFYLPSSSPLLINKGSRTAGAASLYHFTTQTSNAKEAGSLVDIGPHYLSLTLNAPTDSNGDGVGDFLADRNGNGSEDADEMPWNTTNTGDLGILWPLNNSTVNGILRLHPHLGINSPAIAYAEIIVDGTCTRGNAPIRNPSTSITDLEVDTTHLSNGPHEVRLKVTYPAPMDGTGRDRITSSSSSINVIVANEVSYSPWQRQAEQAVNVAIRATAALPNYTLWFFDSEYPVSYTPTPISSAAGTASAGAISFSDSPANLGYGSCETDPSIYSIVELAAPGVSPSAAHANKHISQLIPFPPLGKWVVSYQDSAGDYVRYQISASPPQYGWTQLTDPVDALGTHYFHGHLLGGWVAAAERSTTFESVPLLVLPGGASQTWPVRGTQGEATLKKDAKRLLALLSGKDLGVRNFFGNGHGIGYYFTPADGFMGLDEKEFADKLKNIRYRFVFLNGCETASTGLLSAFGAENFEIPHGFAGGPPFDPNYNDGSPRDISAYSGNLRPAAFLCWSESVGYTETVGNQDYFRRRLGFFIGQIAANWSLGQGAGPMTLEEAISRARQDTITLFGSSAGQEISALRHHGYRNLRCSEYEHGTDWP